MFECLEVMKKIYGIYLGSDSSISFFYLVWWNVQLMNLIVSLYMGRRFVVSGVLI
jgi:hypothetical protein